MSKPPKPAKPKSTEEILREMEDLSGKSPGAEPPSAQAEGGSAFKSLLGFFVKVVPEEAPPPAPKVASPSAPKSASAPRAGPRVADLVAGEPAPKFAAPETAAVDLAQKPLAEIYREAGITDCPCSADELATLMENPTVANQPLSVKVIAINLALSAKGIHHDVPIADAVRRDRALDAYQAMLLERARAAEQRNTNKIQQLTREAEEYLKRKQAEMDALRAEIAEAKRQATDFSRRREAEEQRLASLISPFLEGKPNPVTVGNQASEVPPEPGSGGQPRA
jgi:hypothetical protein